LTPKAILAGNVWGLLELSVAEPQRILGLLGIVAGVLTLFWPGMTALVLLFFIGSWAAAIGVMQIIGAIRLRKEIDAYALAHGILLVSFSLRLRKHAHAATLE